MSKNRVCAVIGCNNINYYIYKSPDGVQRRFFRFPRAMSMCIKWIERLNRLDLYPILEEKGSIELWKNYRVCSDHFVKKDFTKLRPPLNGSRIRPVCLLGAAVPSQNLGNENEIYVAAAPSTQLLEEVEEKEKVENIQVKAEPLPELPQESDISGYFTPFETCDLVQVEPTCDLVEIEPTVKSRKPQKTPKEIISKLRQKLAMTEDLLCKYRLESKVINENFQEFDRVKNRYIDYHSVDACKGKDSCTCQRDFALDLYMKSPQVYKSLQKKFLLPHTSVLYRWKLQKEQEELRKELKLSAEP